MYRFVVLSLSAIFRTFRLIKVEGLNHLPENSKFVITCTHRGWLEILFLPVAVYPVQVHFMAKKELFAHKWIEKFLISLKAFPVNRENPGPSSLKTPIKLLRAGHCVGIFPSGTRTSEEASLKRGAATIAVKAGVPIIPVGYNGPQTIKELFQGKKAILRIGEPIWLDPETTAKEDLIPLTLIQMEAAMNQLEQKKDLI